MFHVKHSGLTSQTKKEILDAAEKWWEATGRHLVPKAVNERQDPPSVRTTTGPIFVSRKAVEQDLNDGILRALPWEELKGEEQARIMFEYFQNIFLPAHPEVKLERRGGCSEPADPGRDRTTAPPPSVPR